MRVCLEGAAHFGIEYYDEFDRRQGIVHIIGPEQGFTLPGTTIVCGDSHTSTHGAFGALAHGIGTSEVEHVLATQTLIQSKAKNMRFTVDGKLPDGGTALQDDPDRPVFRGNGANGIKVMGRFSANGIRIEDNTVAFNRRHGVYVEGPPTTEAPTPHRNSVFSNGGLGIDLLHTGPIQRAGGRSTRWAMAKIERSTWSRTCSV